MSLRVWLTGAAENHFSSETVVVAYSQRTQEVVLLNGFEVKLDRSGARYIDLEIDPLDPASNVPNIDHKFVKRFSLIDRYYVGLRNEGIYKLRSATARVVTKYTYRGDPDAKDVYQEISVSARSLKTLCEIYTKVRAGDLQTETRWGAI